jgi:Transposase DDE domain group 1
MATACIAQSPLQVHGISKPIIARFDQPQASSDGGAILLKVIDDRLSLTWRLATAIRDRRQPGKVAHPLRDLLRQRVFGLACGYTDCNDAARLGDDPIHKLLLERDPLEGDLYRLGTALSDAVLTYHRERLGDGVRLITIDLDATDDPTHGQQEFALFNGYYDTWCYLPLIATVTFNIEPIQYVVAALLRPGTGAPTRGVRGLLRRLFTKLRTLFPRARLRVRADAGFADAKLLAFLDAAAVEYVLGLAGNQRLDKRVRRLLGRARMQARTTGETATLYGETRYAARRWDHKRRIIMKAEVWS